MNIGIAPNEKLGIKKKLNHGEEQLKAIIGELIDNHFTFDYLNGVLSCEKAFGKLQLWYWWGNLLIVRPGQKRAGDMNELADWNTKEDGVMELIPLVKKGEDSIIPN